MERASPTKGSLKMFRRTWQEPFEVVQEIIEAEYGTEEAQSRESREHVGRSAALLSQGWEPA